jgi:hypothetical protein
LGKNPDGNVKICPLVGWETFIPYGMACGLRLHYVKNEAMLLGGSSEAIPLVLIPAQARELSQVLVRLADKAQTPASPDERGN